VPALGDLNVAVLIGGPATFAGFVWLAHMFVQYQRDFTNQYRQRMREQDIRLDELRVEIDALVHHVRECENERLALRATVRQAGISWDPNEWVRR
jgi:hypothetical protein